MEIKRDPKFQKLLRPLTSNERAELKASVEENGILDPINVTEEGVVVDGHHRLDIADELGIDPPLQVVSFETEADAEKFIVRKQLARRNLNKREFNLFLGRLYNKSKHARGGSRSKSDTAVVKNTADSLAAEFGVSRATVKRSGQYAAAFDSLPDEIQQQLEDSPSTASVSAVKQLAAMDRDRQYEAARGVSSGDLDSFDDAVAQSALPDPRCSESGKEVWTVGYQKWPPKDRWSSLVAALKAARIEVLCDIRHSPCSSSLDPTNSYGPRTWHVQAGNEGIASSLSSEGIDYRWIVELGNPQKKDPAMAVLSEHLADPSGRWPTARGLLILREIIESGKRCCLMCACQIYEDCHRKSVAEALSGVTIHQL